MTEEISERREDHFLNSVLPHGLTIAIMIGMWLLTANGLIGSILSQNLILSFYYGVGLIFMTWLFITPITVCTLSIHMYKHLNERNYGRVEADFYRALTFLRRLPVYKGDYIPTLLSNLALARLMQGHYDSAEALFREALSLTEKYFRNGRRGERWLPSLLVLHNNLATTCIRQNNYVEAELLIEAGLELLFNHDKERFRVYAAPLHLGASVIRNELGELKEASEQLEKAISLLSKSGTPRAWAPIIKTLRIHCDMELALISARKGDLAQSQTVSERILQASANSFSTGCLHRLNSLANEYINHRLYERSEQLLELAYSIARDHPFHPDSQKTLSSYENQLLLTDRQSEVGDMRSWLRTISPEI